MTLFVNALFGDFFYVLAKMIKHKYFVTYNVNDA